MRIVVQPNLWRLVYAEPSSHELGINSPFLVSSFCVTVLISKVIVSRNSLATVPSVVRFPRLVFTTFLIRK